MTRVGLSCVDYQRVMPPFWRTRNQQTSALMAGRRGPISNSFLGRLSWRLLSRRSAGPYIIGTRKIGRASNVGEGFFAKLDLAPRMFTKLPRPRRAHMAAKDLQLLFAIGSEILWPLCKQILGITELREVPTGTKSESMGRAA